MDPYCGYCRRFQSILLPLTKERKDLKIIYKALPILGQESKLAAEEELAANAIGRFSDYHEAIYESAVKTRQERFDLATKANFDMAQFKDNIPGIGKSAASASVDKRLDDNIKLAQKLKINGTPAFIVGDELYPGAVDKNELVEILNKQKK
jgi:protein-disulfide isomerase